MIRPDQQAALDQAQAELPAMVRGTRVLFDAYLAEGFTESQAMRLTIAFLDRLARTETDGE